VIVDDIFVGTHGHDCCFDFDLMEDILFWDLHDSDCPAFIRVFPIESLINSTHSSFSKLFGKAVAFIGIIWQEMNLLNLFIKVTVANQGIVRYFLFFLQASHNLKHHLRILLNELAVYIVLGKKLHHVRCQTLDPARTIQVHF
jgi:hypothetical protein